MIQEMTLSERSEFVIFCIVFSKVLMHLVLPGACSRSIIHPICKPVFTFCQLYKSPLDLDGADCSVAWETGYIQVFLRTIAEVSGNSCTLYLPFSIPIFTHIFILSVARFYVFASFIKDPLDLDGAICSVVCVTETGLSPSKARRRFPALCYSLLRRVVGLPPGRRQLSEMGEKCKDKIFII